MSHKDPDGYTPYGRSLMDKYVRESYERAGLPVPDDLQVLTLRPSEEIRLFFDEYTGRCVNWKEGDVQVSIMRRGPPGPGCGFVRLEFHPDGTCSRWVLDDGPLVVNPVFDKPRKVKP